MYAASAGYFLKNVVILIVLIVAIYYTSYNKRLSLLHILINLYTTFSVIFAILVIFELSLRVINFIVDVSINHATKTDTSMAVQIHFNFTLESIIVSVWCVCSLIIMCFTSKELLTDIWSSVSDCIWPVLLSIFILRLVNFSGTGLDSFQQVKSMYGLDYGSSMATSYFYGYLKILLPSDTYYRGIEGNIQMYEARENVTLPVKKLFVLIPETGFIPPDLSMASDGWFERTKNLESVYRDRAGIRERQYKNTIYKIHPGGLDSGRYPVYVCAEGASPLLTFYEVVKHSHRYSDLYRSYQNEIITSFKNTLQHLLDDNIDCGKYCQLVFYKADENPATVLLNILINKYNVTK